MKKFRVEVPVKGCSAEVLEINWTGENLAEVNYNHKSFDSVMEAPPNCIPHE